MPVKQRPFLAFGLRLVAMAFLSATFMLAKVGGQRGIALPEMMFWRQFVPALMLVAWLGLRRNFAIVKTERPWVHVRRAIIGTLGMFLTLGVVQVLPLAEATILGFTAPVFAVILATVLLREHVGIWRWSAVVIGLLGVAVIAGPDRTHLPLFGLAIGLGAAFFVALVAIQLRDMGRTEDPVRIVFWFSTLSAVMLSPALFLYGSEHDLGGWLLIVGIGVIGLFGQLFLTASLRFGSVSAVIVMDYSQLGWSTLWGWLIFAQLPPANTWLGAPLIVIAGLVIARREQLLHRRPPLSPGVLPPAN